MNKKLSSIIDELDKFLPEKTKYQLIELRARNAIAGVANVLNLIESCFTQEESEALIKRFNLALKNNDPQKFQRKVKELHESHRKTK